MNLISSKKFTLRHSCDITNTFKTVLWRTILQFIDVISYNKTSLSLHHTIILLSFQKKENP